MRTSLFVLLALAGAAQGALVVDRGLPTTNLNNVSGANRSNVAWADSDPNVVYGDSFNIGTPGTFTITGVRLWVVTSAANISDRWTSLTLYTGSSTPISALSTVSTTGDPNVSITPVTYSGGAQYQTNAGGFINMFQVDFQNLNWVVDGSTTYNFFLGGAGFSVNPTLHASNAALSGSTQQGSNNTMLYYDFGSPGIMTWDSNGDGWDKSSDINVQVFAADVPEPSSLALMLTGLATFLVVRKKR